MSRNKFMRPSSKDMKKMVFVMDCKQHYVVWKYLGSLVVSTSFVTRWVMEEGLTFS